LSDVGERELLAIIFTDAVDSTARTASDEDYSLRILLADLDYMRNEAAVRGGTVLKNTGDGLLISFKSAVDAVECALSIQRGFANRAENAAFTHKIGVHIGDVIKKDGDIYGTGVNTASRLVAQCPKGGLCLSSTLYELVKQKSQIGTLKKTEFQLTNIEPPIKAYKIIEIQLDQTPHSFDKEKLQKRKSGLSYIWVFLLVAAGCFVGYKAWNLIYAELGIKQARTEVKTSTSTPAKPLDKKDPIIGIWQYGNGATTTFYPDGTVRQIWDGGGVPGKLEKIDAKTYRLNFNENQWIETVKINEEGTLLVGNNNFGGQVTAGKVSSEVEKTGDATKEDFLTGVWENEIKEKYYLKHFRKTIIMYAEEKQDDPRYAHVIVGEISENGIEGTLYDLPKGKSSDVCQISAQIISPSKIKLRVVNTEFQWVITRGMPPSVSPAGTNSR